MEKTLMAGTDLRVSRIVAGCMGLGGGWDRTATITREFEDRALAFIDAAVGLGINFFDHADVYAYGRAEETFGRALAHRPGLRDRIVIQSKAGIRWANEPPGSPHRFDFSHDHIVAEVEGSLRRLGTDYLDILLLHRPDPLMEGEEVARAFSELKAAGKVRHFGVSNHNRAQMEYVQSFLDVPIVANQLQMSLLHHGFAEAAISFNQTAPGYPDGWEGVLEYCALHGVALQAWSPLDKGALAGGADLSRLSAREREAVPRGSAVVAEIAEARGVPAEAVALAWLMRHPAGILPVTGTSDPGRLAACAAASGFVLTREEWYRLFEAVRGKGMP